MTWNERARDAYLTNKAWSSGSVVAKSLNDRWPHKYHPVLALSPTRLIVAAGGNLTSYSFGFIPTERKSTVVFEGTYQVFPSAPACDITGIVFLPDGGKNETLLVSNISGELVRIRLPSPLPIAQDTEGYPRSRLRTLIRQVIKTAHYSTPENSIKALASVGSTALAVSSTGYASMVQAASPWVSPSTVRIARVAWSTHLRMTASTPYAAIGTNSNAVVHPLSNDGLSTEPIAVLAGPSKSTPVYTVQEFLPGGSPEIIATGWFDGKVRVYDLRSSSRTLGTVEPLSNSSLPASLTPVLTLSDSWRSFDPIYSLAARGEMSDPQAKAESRAGGLPHQYHYLAAGSALHSVVCLWDVRRPSTGWSVYAPGGDRSPVYALRAEGSRIWGATQWRAFVLDFGSEAKDTIYPRVEDGAMDSTPPTYLHFPERY